MFLVVVGAAEAVINDSPRISTNRKKPYPAATKSHMEIGELDVLQVHRTAVARSACQLLLGVVSLRGVVEEAQGVSLTQEAASRSRGNGRKNGASAFVGYLVLVSGREAESAPKCKRYPMVCFHAGVESTHS